MTAKEYLSEIRVLKDRLKIGKSILDNCHISYDALKGMDYASPKVQSSPKNSMEEAAWKMLEGNEDAFKHVCFLSGEVNKRLKEIKDMDNPVYIEILYDRYYEGITLPEIADKMDKTLKTINNLHGAALTEFQRLYGKEFL